MSYTVDMVYTIDMVNTVHVIYTGFHGIRCWHSLHPLIEGLIKINAKLVLSFFSLAPLYWVTDCIKKELFCKTLLPSYSIVDWCTLSLEILFLVVKVVFVCFSAPPQYWHKCFAHQVCVLDLNDGHLMIFVKVFFVCFSAYPQYWYKCFAHQVSICTILGKKVQVLRCIILCSLELDL